MADTASHGTNDIELIDLNEYNSEQNHILYSYYFIENKYY